MAEEVAGEGWRLVRPHPDHRREWVPFDALVPKADWFWASLQRYCVPECCGLAAYDFSAESVAWACGWGTVKPTSEFDWREATPGDAQALATALRTAAGAIRQLDAKAVAADLFNDILTPEAYASLFEDLAGKATPPP